MYRLVFTDDAKKDLLQLQKKAPVALKKLNILLEEIREHPTTGTGQGGAPALPTSAAISYVNKK